MALSGEVASAASQSRSRRRRLSACGPAQRARKPVPGALKQRAHQLSVYLEPEVYDRLRDIAHD